MGYLTDPSGFHGKPFRMVLNHQVQICAFLYFSSLVWYVLLSHDQINQATYLSENALLPGLVVVEFNDGERARSLLYELEHESKGMDGIPTHWIVDKLELFGLEAFVQNFTLNHPLRPGVSYSGENVYGILRGGGASTESIVLSVPYRPYYSNFPQTSAGLALVLSIANYFRRQKYWAKDIIFLFTEHEQLGTQAWLEAYHGVASGTPGVVMSGKLYGRGGAIQAAVVLELDAVGQGGAKALTVRLAGLNGQLPNLDLYNLAHRICSKERVEHTFHKTEYSLNSPFMSKKHVDSFLKMGSMLLTQATGVPDGNHGLYHRFGIEAVTIEGYHASRGRVLSYADVGRVVEGVFRSINNLLERFHQSYFFYLLADYDRFVSIGYYMPCVGLLAGALFIKAFRVYLTLRTIWIEHLYSQDAKRAYPDLNTVGTGVAVMIAYFCGFLVYSAPPFFVQILHYLSTEDAILYGFLATSFISFLLPILMSRKFGPPREDWYLLQMCIDVLFATLLTAVAMHNFSLAFLVGIVVCPVFLCLNSKNNRWIIRSLVAFCHPMTLITCAVAASAWVQHGDLSMTREGLSSTLALAAVDIHVYAAAALPLTTLFYLPVWILAMLLACH